MVQAGHLGGQYDQYPKKLKQRLRHDSPSVLYGCGEHSVFGGVVLAIVGSRDADEALLDYTRQVAVQAADAGRVVVSGAARGVDQAAMNAALDEGGSALGVLAGDLERTVMKREHRNLLLEGKVG